MKTSTFAASAALFSLFAATGCSSTAPVEETKEYDGALTFYPTSVIPVFVKAHAAVDPACITTVGSCRLSDCAAPVADATPYSAGDLTISGGSLNAPLSLGFATQGYSGYPYGAFSAGGYASGDTLHVSASGADVASFAGTTSPAPGDVTLVAPAFTDALQGRTAGYALDPSRDVEIGWTGGTSGSDVVVTVSNLDDESRVRSIECIVDATSGHVAVPASLAGALGAPTNGFLSVYSRTKTTLTTENASIDVSMNGSLTAGAWSKQ